MALGFLLIAGGVVAALAGAFVTGIWFIFIGWFLRTIAEGSYRQMAMQNLLRGSPVGLVTNRYFQAVPPELSLSSLVSDYVLASSQRCYPVMSQGRLLGLVTLADLGKFPRGEWDERCVSEAMTPREQLRTVRPSDGLAYAAEAMAALDLHQLPVIEDDTLLGFVTRSDILRWIQVRQELAAREETTEHQKASVRKEERRTS
jgi:CBS domain-containing protein